MVRYNVFHINDILEKIDAITVPYPTSILPDSVQPGYSRPGLTAGIENQGLSKYVPDECNVTELKNVISISANGANSGATFYQDHLFTIIQDAYAVKIRDDVLKDPVRELYLYLTAVLNHRLSSYGWENKAGWNKIKDLQIQLPVTDSGQLDVQYMEQYIKRVEADYIKRVEADYIKRVEAYLATLGYESLDDCELSSQDLKVLSGPDEWGEFKIDKLFDVLSSNSKINAKSLSVIYDRDVNNSYPYVVRSAVNNGVKGYIVSDCKLNSSKTISFAQDTAEVFYRDRPYFTGDKIKVLKPLHFVNEKDLLYLVTAIRRAFMLFQWGSNSYNEKIISSTVIKLPVTPDGKPDYNFMDQYIMAIEKKKVLKLKRAMEHKLELYRDVSHQN